MFCYHFFLSISRNWGHSFEHRSLSKQLSTDDSKALHLLYAFARRVCIWTNSEVERNNKPVCVSFVSLYRALKSRLLYRIRYSFVCDLNFLKKFKFFGLWAKKEELAWVDAAFCWFREYGLIWIAAFQTWIVRFKTYLNNTEYCAICLHIVLSQLFSARPIKGNGPVYWILNRQIISFKWFVVFTNVAIVRVEEKTEPNNGIWLKDALNWPMQLLCNSSKNKRLL